MNNNSSSKAVHPPFDCRPKITEEQKRIILNNKIVLSRVLGLQILRPNNKSPQVNADHATESVIQCYQHPIAFTLFPSKFPKHVYDKAIQLANVFNLLIAAVQSNQSILTHLETAAKGDAGFTGKLYDMWLRTRNSHHSLGSLSLNRSDYFAHSPNNDWDLAVPKQVELNTVSVGLGHLSMIIGKIHHFNVGLFGDPLHLPQATLSIGIGNQMAQVHKYFCTKTKSHCAKALVLFIIQEREKNIFDQYGILSSLSQHGVITQRVTLQECVENGQYDPKTHHYVFKGSIVSLIYFRAGYTPSDFYTQELWNCREDMEKSTAIKCPSLAQHLMGSKKFQQLCSNRSFVESIFPGSSISKPSLDAMFDSFVGLYSLDPKDNPNLGDLLKKIRTSPGEYILKPQREGGGNNLYDKDIITFLDSNPDLSGWIAMDRIKPLKVSNDFIIDDSIVSVDSASSELGIFGWIFLDNQNKIVSEGCFGPLLRTKPDAKNEGGIASGQGSLDFPYLV